MTDRFIKCEGCKVNIPKEDMLALGKCTVCSRPYEAPEDQDEPTPSQPANAPVSKPKRKRWVELKSKRGRTYYHNTETGEDTWEKPADIDADAVEDGFVPFKNDAVKNAVLREQAKADATKMGLPPTVIAAMQARQQEHDAIEDPFDKMLSQPSSTATVKPPAASSPHAAGANYTTNPSNDDEDANDAAAQEHATAKHNGGGSCAVM
ncbi:hypothetical protein PINS_up012124 [Pythium insidiosum]|nr:hypothetical protein PINS_up012124 [Pythium insidiosum]